MEKKQKEKEQNQQENLKETLFKTVRVALVYILPSVLIAILISQEFRDFLALHVQIVGLVPVINVALVALATQIKQNLPSDSTIKKVL